eukprot:scaffold2013_cov138-Isochrysis_galbana.AAC.2
MRQPTCGWLGRPCVEEDGRDDKCGAAPKDVVGLKGEERDGHEAGQDNGDGHGKVLQVVIREPDHNGD